MRPLSSIDAVAMSLLSKRKQRNDKDSKPIGKMVCLLASAGRCREIDHHEDDWIWWRISEFRGVAATYGEITTIVAKTLSQKRGRKVI